VGRAFAFYTHGEIDPSMADYLLGYEAGPNGLLAKIGVDGILVDRANAIIPKPASEWVLVHDGAEGRVYHRVGGPLPRLRSAESSPNEKWAEAKVKLLGDSRAGMSAEVALADGKDPALLLFSQPYFDGYRATINERKIEVGSYRGLIPTIQLPPGTHGRLTMVYRPWWLLVGGAIAALSALVIVLSGVLALRARAQ
jgi:hypothetical protein